MKSDLRGAKVSLQKLPRSHGFYRERDYLGAQVHKAYMGFYFRPSYILRAILRIRSFGEIGRSVKAVVGMALGFIKKLRKNTLPLCHGGPA